MTDQAIELKPIQFDADGRLEYVCGCCGANGVKLWRLYSSFMSSQTLACLSCSEKDQGKVANLQKGDQIGFRIPAVPTEEKDTFWGYSSVPDDGVKWWVELPTHEAQP